jgi:tRNA-splicing ligase RtcB
MDPRRLVRQSAVEWRIEPQGAMRVPGVLLASEDLLRIMDDQVYHQVIQVATLPGVVEAVYALPDARHGHGFPRGGVAAFDPEQGGVIVSGGVGMDIGWGARVLHTGLNLTHLLPYREALADALHVRIPNGNGARVFRLSGRGMDAMLCGGAHWAVEMGYGVAADLERIEEQGCMAGADPRQVSELAKTRQLEMMGILRGPCQYLEVQRVAQVYDRQAAGMLGIQLDDITVTIHCGSHSLGQQLSADHRLRLAAAADRSGIFLPDQNLACAPLDSEAGQRYLGAMRAGINCAHANRQILTQLTRRAFARLFPEVRLDVLYDVSYNTCRPETHEVEGQPRTLHVHRKGASRALGPGHPDLPAAWRDLGQPGLIGGRINTASYITVATGLNQERAFTSSCHGVGPGTSPPWMVRAWQGLENLDVLRRLGTLVRGPGSSGVVENAPEAGPDFGVIVDVAEQVGLTKRVARLEPLIHIKG